MLLLQLPVERVLSCCLASIQHGLPAVHASSAASPPACVQGCSSCLQAGLLRLQLLLQLLRLLLHLGVQLHHAGWR
jgi:hypothetical protein